MPAGLQKLHSNGAILDISQRKGGFAMNCTYNEALYDHCFRTIDSHTMGEATRIIYDGFPELPGDTMMKKKEYYIRQMRIWN